MEDDFDESEMFSPSATAPKMPSAINPLAKYFRVPGLNVRLPSKGAYMPRGAINFTLNGEIAVSPMRAADELLMKSPDALMSGYAIEQLILSCAPEVKAPRLLSMADLDVLLLGIRAASYGEKMEVESTCPECGEASNFDVNLPAILATVKDLPPECLVRLSEDIIVSLRPYNVENGTQVAMAAFDESRRLQFAENEPENVRMQMLNESYSTISKLNADMMAQCVIHVITPEGMVMDPTMIREFINNIPRKWGNKIEKKLKELNSIGMDKRVDVKCGKCEHEWKTELEFNPANFFDQDS
ncbi:MAG: hypothetical protein EOP83_06225 [Verrucomicrobiaceae bacterium]|nr:MAG: hypothetical protein EOP83_06225 [Verrucomicrobiaceae bacterium]